jgi:dihydroxy-acid dehydratase
MVSEALGLSVPNVSMVPGVFAERMAYAREAAALVMAQIHSGGPLPREIVTRRSLENAVAIVAATGGSTNAVLHIPAIAHEAGIRFTMEDAAAVLERTPLIADLRPGGRFTAKDVYDIGGAAVVIRELMLSGFIDGTCLTVTGRNLREIYGGAPAADGAVVRPCAAPLSANGGVVVLKGNLCPDGAVIKVAGLESLVFEGSPRVFEREEECAEAVRERSYRAMKGRWAAPACARCWLSPRSSMASRWARLSPSSRMAASPARREVCALAT